MDETSDDAPSVGRRTVLRRSAGVAAGSVALAGVGAAQENGTDTANGTDDGGASGGTGTVTNVAISQDAPRFGKSDYVGMFLKVGDEIDAGDTPPVTTCSFFRSDDQLQTLGTTLVSPTVEEIAQDVRIYARGSDPALTRGKTYIVNNQQSCGGELLQLQLEETNRAPEINEVIANLNETNGTGGTGGGGGTTTTNTPGFGVGAAIAGIAAGISYALRRND